MITAILNGNCHCIYKGSKHRLNVFISVINLHVWLTKWSMQIWGLFAPPLALLAPPPIGLTGDPWLLPDIRGESRAPSQNHWHALLSEQLTEEKLNMLRKYKLLTSCQSPAPILCFSPSLSLLFFQWKYFKKGQIAHLSSLPACWPNTTQFKWH